MSPDHVALMTITSIAKSVALSAMPNAPVVDDSNDAPSIGQRLTSARRRVAELISPGAPSAPSYEQRPATIPGC